MLALRGNPNIHNNRLQYVPALQASTRRRRAARLNAGVREIQDMEDVNEFINALWASQKGRGIDDGLGDVSILDDAEQENARKASVLLQPLLRIFDEQVLWLTRLHEVLDPKIICPTEDKTGSIVWAYFGLATSNAVALRRCILSGFEPASATILRSFIETLEIAVLLFFYEEFRREFHSAVASKDSEKKEFELWGKYVGYGKLHKNLLKLDLDLDVGQEWTEAYIEWRKEEKKYLSATVHPTGSSAYNATYTDSLESKGLMGRAVHGHMGSGLVRSVFAAVRCTWLVSQYVTCPTVHGFKDPLKPLYIFDRDNADDLRIVCGAALFSELVYNGYGDPAPVFDNSL